jgi:uncharacterized protein
MIRSVSADGIQIGADLYDRTIALTVDAVLDDWTPEDVCDLKEADFSNLLELSPEVIVLGTGSSNIFPPRELVFAMARRRVGFEVMDTAAAARTYNVLAGEGRQVAAVLYLPNE